MKVFRTILCPVDFSDFSDLALQYEGAMAKQYEARLLVYHAIPDLAQALTHLDVTGMDVDGWLATSKKEVERVTGRILPPEVPYSVMTEVELVTRGILKCAEQEKADLIVMGTHGRTGFERYLLGSSTTRVLHHSPAPVLTVCRPTRGFVQLDGPQPVNIRRILCPVDFERGTTTALDSALSLARSYGSELHLMHIGEPGKEPFSYFYPKRKNLDKELRETEQKRLVDVEKQERLRQIVKKLEDVLPAEKEDWCTVRYHAGEGRPAEGILKAVEENAIELVVMGHHTRLPVVEAFVGSVTQKVITRSGCPVLVVRG